MINPTKEEIEAIFKKWEELAKQQIEVTIAKKTPLPQPLTIEEYRKRQSRNNYTTGTKEVIPKKTRAGEAQRYRRQLKNL